MSREAKKNMPERPHETRTKKFDWASITALLVVVGAIGSLYVPEYLSGTDWFLPEYVGLSATRHGLAALMTHKRIDALICL